ncbi:hypothetical protein NQX30_05200 [Candidatus Persebacteraceae bacterium Df01]|uniref:Phosphoribosylglycinamide synthetase ATP-grasp (A) domain-containing protein n=1 Tax=Candidatus Doriopsillibacter californiensis TaxID=2970740 RepID=A0ABT7QM13_9GAMM|nr:hypothetical protein [Candidatus Persebacteraceae bacterium Df01]
MDDFRIVEEWFLDKNDTLVERLKPIMKLLGSEKGSPSLFRRASCNLNIGSNKSMFINIPPCENWLTLNGNGAIQVSPSQPTLDLLCQLRALRKQNAPPYRFLVEDYLEGFDYSAHYLLNKYSVVQLPSAQDYKKSHCDDQCTNCDGMRGLSPHPREIIKLKRRIRSEILDPMLGVLRHMGIIFNGAIYLGL